MSTEPDFTELTKNGITRESSIVKGTTLFDCIPYDGVDKDEKDIVREQIRKRRIKDPKFGVNNLNFSEYMITAFNRGQEPVDAGPVIQLISVNVFNTSPQWKFSKIYGQISLTTNQGSCFSIYNRDPQDPERIHLRKDLSLVPRPLAPGTQGKLSVSIFTITDDCIFDSEVILDYSDMGDMGDGLTVRGNNGYYVKLVYNIIPFAIIADITMQLIGPVNARLNTITVQGQVNANSEDFTISLLKHKKFKVLRKEDTQYIYPILLSRPVIAMPAYSLLPVEFSLTREGALFANETVKNDPYWPNGFGVFISCVDNGYHIGLSVDWLAPDNAFDLFPERKAPVASDHYAEVFSVVVGCSDVSKEPLAICGTIIIADKKETVYIYSREAYCPDNLSTLKRRLQLAWPNDRWVLEKDFFMHLKLKDANGRSVCRGYLSWACDSDVSPSRFDRRMCSVIRGENGYFAAVHYSIFRDGLRAKVTIHVECEYLCDGVDVYGSVLAEYNNYDYRSAYDQEYNRVVIFDRPEEFCARMTNCSELPISKSLVTAPADCKELVVCVDLDVYAFNLSSVASYDLFVKNKLEFTTSTNSRKRLRMHRRGDVMRHSGYLIVTMEWFDRSHGYRVNEESNSPSH